MALKARNRFIVTEPSVYVVGTQRVLDDEVARFLADEGFPGWKTDAPTAGQRLVEVAGRVCYLSFGGGRGHRDYLANLKRDRHGSVLEHATINLIFTGVSRSFTHEVVRHRAGWSYSQLSQRFVAETAAQMVCPAVVAACRDQAEWSYIYFAWRDAVERARIAYDHVAESLRRKLDPPARADDPASLKDRTRTRKLINGAARSLLPNATETKLFASVNARAFRHFLEARAHPAADPEIRTVAMTAYRAALPHWPDLLSDYEVRRDEDGDEYLATPYLKV